jgi:hypothetical protein
MKIGLFYLIECGYDIEYLLTRGREAYEIMKKEFSIFDCDSLLPYEISSSVAGKIRCYREYVARDCLLGLRHIVSMKEMKPPDCLRKLCHRLKFKFKRVCYGGESFSQSIYRVFCRVKIK